MLGTTEWIVIGSIAVLLFGAPQILKWAKALGQARKEFREAAQEIEDPVVENKKQ
jgi:TatA/E family protein of Tat protein translocase